ncbi:GntR family transcriptional regulator [Ruegeria lacuscaerulensis]|uniref:GntR family transcriptional regulator n=1 Tax=Ruegeria lacuscaerulensis TaxID=55218 RepID=UPI00147ED7EA|nr:GntR family transcriptional regulator [Ruegeria lacuscaerulensis]
MDISPDSTSSADIYDTLRDGLIWGRWKSGQRLKPQHLKDEFGCSTAALREALLRLAGEGFVENEKNHGFRAVEHSDETFQQAAHLRMVLECEAVELALKQGDFEWEMALNAAHHNLDYIEARMEQAEDVTPFVKRWSRQDWVFHSTLLGACNSDLLMRIYKSVYDTFRMCAVSRIEGFGFSQLTRHEHRAIYDAAIARDLPECIGAIRAHLALYRDDKRPIERPEQMERDKA